MKYYFYLFAILFLSCKPEPSSEPTLPSPVIPHDIFSFTLDDNQLNLLYTSIDTNYALADPIPTLWFNEELVEVKKMKTRGTSASRVRRKSFNVDTEEFLSFEEFDGTSFAESKDFRLLAMAFDLCYIENRIGFGLLQQAQLFPLFFKYVEVQLNNKTNGVYFLIENPNDYYLDKNDFAFLMRRSYYGKIDSYKYDDNGDGFAEQDYIDAFESIYTNIANYQGVELFKQLDEVLDVRQYMQKIAYDYLIQNGDYTDEVYLYDTPGDDKIRFSVIPWDLDDIFADQPHEIGVAWGTGHIFGTRYYGSQEDIINDVGEKLLFSIEDDLDYVIAKDPYLYAIYLEEMEKLTQLITEEDIRQEFDRIEEELTGFFQDPDIVEQTSHDASSCDPLQLVEEIKDKATLLISRRQRIIDQL